jgi:hypothetical protein
MRKRGKQTYWEVSMIVTYLVNAIECGGFSKTKELLNNQADVSIMRP